MANWVTIENGEITGYYDLVPENSETVSGLNKAKDNLEFMRSVGWYPVHRQPVDPYDIERYELGSFRYEIFEDCVHEIPVVTLRPQIPVPPSFQELKSVFMAQLREARNKLLADSDYTQLLDFNQTLEETARNRWISYRQALRDIPAKYEDNDILSLEQVSWPEV